MGKLIDLSGHKFGRLTVLCRAPVNTLKPHWACLCDCGQRRTVGGSDLKLGKSRSCGCLVRETTSIRNYRHGGAPRSGLAPEYIAWTNMNRRCHDPENHAYPLYGGRGIQVCDAWRTSYAAFIADMGPRPFEGATLDRINSDGHYCKANCRWASMHQQANNKRNNTCVTIMGERMTVAQLARSEHISYDPLLRRINAGTHDPTQAVEDVRRVMRGPRKRR